MDWDPLPQRPPKSKTQKPRVIANVQLAPSRERGTPRKLKIGSTVNAEEDLEDAPNGTKRVNDSDWTASNRKSRRRNRLKSDSGISGNNNQARSHPKESEKRPKVKGVGPSRMPPKTAAVSITGRSKDFSYRDALMNAKKEISLTELKIEKTRIRRTANGGYLIEILDANGEDKAKALLKKLRALLPEEQAVVAPVTSGELRFIGLDDTISVEEVAELIALEGKCDVEKVKVGSI
ncbi:hypothetical protein RF55_15191 [Lasius niger]|uniref:Gag-pol polyprotein n=1 Tax=Lasius niger TaxID=67767 RepID=A0A0J7K713_LASNI|nr:hypothetical protein RF55_15191 [Lasius niger]